MGLRSSSFGVDGFVVYEYWLGFVERNDNGFPSRDVLHVGESVHLGLRFIQGMCIYKLPESYILINAHSVVELFNL